MKRYDEIERRKEGSEAHMEVSVYFKMKNTSYLQAERMFSMEMEFECTGQQMLTDGAYFP